ncbi:sigma factor-like helix-turn-helix DNA-binding protein [Microvirga sp. VF16]|uniref:sigma factor-like helix-turn-helix DNA-binding protein n=1 Tax=Microvirga sp. VF16 TaxID=2807101 RepID=UPI00193D7904|nr:sigma factor-like helix-turn-helix DNA-binding protein [Microvirga sp. VF16]QRM35560.1 RNA polymerase subunit sigma-70 [Microvirga sp. VF16]
MATLKQFEEALRAQGMHMALAILEKMRKEEKKSRSIAPARRVSGRKMTPELARKVLELHNTTDMTQQEIAFRLGVNQGRVNEVIRRGKWLTEDPNSEEAQARDKAKARMKRMQSGDTHIPRKQPITVSAEEASRKPKAKPSNPAQLSIDDFLKVSSD